MGLRSFFRICTGFFLGSGVTSANFHERGRRCSLNDALRMFHTGKVIRSAYPRRNQLGILSGPHDLNGLSFDSVFQTRSSDTSRNSGRFFSSAKRVMGHNRRYSSRGSRNALFMEFANTCSLVLAFLIT